MRHLFIINPAAGKRRSSARLEELLGKLSFPCERRRSAKGSPSASTPAGAMGP